MKFCTCGHSRWVHTRLRFRYRCNARHCYCLMYVPVLYVS
jgi:hypothetical protein